LQASDLFSGLFNVARNPVTNRHAGSLRQRAAKVNAGGDAVAAKGSIVTGV
jgi:hypothetical protein